MPGIAGQLFLHAHVRGGLCGLKLLPGIGIGSKMASYMHSIHQHDSIRHSRLPCVFQ